MTTRPVRPAVVVRDGNVRVNPRHRRRRRGRLLAVLLLAVCVGLVGYDLVRSEVPGPVGPPAVAPSLQTGPVPTVDAAPVTVVRAGDGTFSYATGVGAVAGTGGSLQTYRVAVENGLGLGVAGFATAVETVLGDARGWTQGGDLQLQRVDGASPAQFTVYLASPVTSERLCALDGMTTDQYTSCRLQDGRVVINSERWLTAVPNYGASLDVYRAYAVNHEVGHQLGHGHEACPVPGALAPVMQQQTLDLAGCVAYGWPYVGTVRYAGPATAD